MPAKAVKRGKVYRVVETDGTLVRNAAGTPVDGGGLSRARAEAQARAINASKPRRRK